MKSKKIESMAEVLLVIAIFMILAWFIEAKISSPFWGFISKTVMILLSIVAVVSRGKHLEDYGLSIKNLSFSCKWGALFSLTVVTPPLLALLVLGQLKTTIENVESLMVDIFWYFVMVGFAEELFFRGYIQTRLNETFNKHFRKFLGFEVEYGWGLIITAVIFGVVHIFGGINPFKGTYAINPFYVFIAIFATFFGLLFGVIREKTGDIWACSILHGTWDFFWILIFMPSNATISGITMFIGFFIVFGILFEKFLSSDHIARRLSN